MTPANIPVASPVYDTQVYAYEQQQQKSPGPTTVPVFETGDPSLARAPMMMRLCPNCKQESRTRITTYPTWQTWTAAGTLAIVFWPICWVPLVLDNCKKTDHFCVLCQAKVGQVEAFQDCCVTERSWIDEYHYTDGGFHKHWFKTAPRFFVLECTLMKQKKLLYTLVTHRHLFCLIKDAIVCSLYWCLQ